MNRRRIAHRRHMVPSAWIRTRVPILTGDPLYLLSYDGVKLEQCAGFEPAPYGLEDRHAWPLNTSTARKKCAADHHR